MLYGEYRNQKRRDPLEGGRRRTHNCGRPGVGVRDQDVLTNSSASGPVRRNPLSTSPKDSGCKICVLGLARWQVLCSTTRAHLAAATFCALVDIRHHSVDPKNSWLAETGWDFELGLAMMLWCAVWKMTAPFIGAKF